MKFALILASLLFIFSFGSASISQAYGSSYGGGYSSGSGGSGIYINPTFIYYYQYEDNGTTFANNNFIGRTRSEFDIRAGYKLDGVIHFGLLFIQDIYNTQYFYNQRDTYQGYGPYVGAMWDNWDITLGYILNPTLHSENLDITRSVVGWGAMTDYTGTYGLSFDVTYKWNMFGSFDIGPRLCLRYWEYKSRSSVQNLITTTNSVAYRYTTLYPELALYYHF